MAGQLTARSEFAETLAIYLGLKTALKSNRYGKHAAVRSAAERVLKDLSSEKSVFGQQLKMISLLEKGTTIDDLSKRVRCSRRTVFRYLNSLEEAGVGITLESGVYQVDKNVARMLTA